MSYQASSTAKAQQVQQHYLRQYQEAEVSSEGWEDVSVEGGDFFSEGAAEDENAPAQLNRLSRGEGNAESPNYLAELDEMQGDIEDYESGELPGAELEWDVAAAKRQLGELEAEVKKSHLPASLKNDFLKQIRETLKMLKRGELEDSLAIEDLQEEWKTTLEENPSSATRIVNQLSEAGVSTTEEQVQEAMKKYDFTEESFGKLVLPGDKALVTRFMNFLKEVNPKLAETLANDPEKGFSGDALSELQVMVNLVYPKGADLNLIVKLVDQSQKASWDAESVIGKFTGTTRHMESEINNRFYYCDEFARSLHRMSQGQSFGGEDIQNYLNRGRNSCDNGARNKGTEIRRFLSGLYEEANKNPYLFLHYLKQLPEHALLAMKDLLDYRGGGGCDATTKDMGDRWDTTQCSNILDSAIRGGNLPVELQSETTMEMNTQTAQAEAE